VLLAHAEAVHIRWALDRYLGDLSLRTIVAYADEAIDASELQISNVTVMTRPLRIVMRVRG
jgi:hypothetical protein